MMSTTRSTNQVRFTAILIGVLMMPVHSYWISRIEAIVYKGGGGSTSSLIWTSVYNMVVLLVIFRLIQRFWPKLALHRAELLAIFSMCNIAACVAGHDLIQVLIPLITYPQWYASSENEWARILLPYLPAGITVKDKSALLRYFVGESTFYNKLHLLAWQWPFLCWSGFIALLLCVSLAINVIVAKQWINTDRLSYPVIQLPYQLSAPSWQFFKDRLVWLGIATSGLILSINHLNRIFPQIPIIPLRIDLNRYLTESPWNAIGWTPFNIIFNYIGLGFFVPVDILFSCWFFLLTFKIQQILGKIIGFQGLPNFPYSYEQSSGGYLAVSLIALWLTRRHLKWVAETLFGDTESSIYRLAVLTVIIGLGGLILFCSYLGISVWVAIAFFLTYYLIQIAIGRMRAEIGTPLHDLHFGGPSTILMNAFGSRRFTHSTLVGLAQLWCVDRAYRSNAAPHQLETLKIAERIKASPIGFICAMIVACLLAGPMAIWAMLHHSYEVGIQNAAPVNLYFGRETWMRFQSWSSYASETDIVAIGFTGFGFLVTMGLMLGRMRFIWWPFHPLGYAISGSWQMNWGWGSFFIVWLLKLTILKMTGMHGFRRTKGFFLGLLMGNIFVGGTWTMIGIGFDLW